MRAWTISMAAGTLLAGSLAALGPVAAAEGWTEQVVTQSDELLEPRTNLALNGTSGSVVVDAAGVEHMAYLDGGAIKVVSSQGNSWGTPVTAVSAELAGDVDDIHLVTQSGELTLVWLHQATEGLFDKQRIAYTQTSGGVWTGSISVFRSAIYVTKNISIAQNGTDVYVAYQRAGNALAANFEPLIYRIPARATSANPGAELPVIPDVTYINDGYLAASGPNHLAYVWGQEDGFAALPPWQLYIAFFDLRTQTWSTPQLLAEKVYDLSMAGSQTPSASGATGMLVWEEIAGDRRIGAATLRGGSIDATRGATPYVARSVDHLQVEWNSSADQAVAACYCRANNLPSSESFGVWGLTIPATGEIPAYAVLSDEKPTLVRRLDLGGPGTGALTANVTWQTSDRTNPAVFAASYGSGGWSVATDLGSGQWPLAVPSAGPAALVWSAASPYVLTSHTTTHTPRPAPDPGPDPGPGPDPDPEEIVVVISGSRVAKGTIRIMGSTTGIADGAIATPSLKKVKRGQRWKAQSPTTVSVNRLGVGYFESDLKANAKFKYKAYVTIDGVKSNRVTIAKGR